MFLLFSFVRVLLGLPGIPYRRWLGGRVCPPPRHLLGLLFVCSGISSRHLLGLLFVCLGIPLRRLLGFLFVCPGIPYRR